MARGLEALANPTRLALLRRLCEPKILADIEVESAEHPGRNLSRQSVAKHLHLLMEAGIVLDQVPPSDGREGPGYITNHQAIFALAEEVRDLARRRPVVEVSRATIAGNRSRGQRIKGRCAVVVRGLEEGRVFSLEPPADTPEADWIIGRKRGLPVSLDFDPYISAENSLVSWNGKDHLLSDLPQSRNGTLLNFESVPKGKNAVLRHGDIIGVGRSLLVYWALA